MKKTNPNSSSAFPSFFQACCLDARRGGLHSYSNAGYNIALHLFDLEPHALTYDEWAEEIERLCDLLHDNRIEDVRNWFCEHLPRCMKIVPKRRMHQFYKDVYKAFEDERIP